MPKALVSGGAGFIGSHVVDVLLENGYDVVVVDNLDSGSLKNVDNRAKFYRADILSDAIDTIFSAEKPDYVFHLAAQISVSKSLREPVYDANVNILGSINIIENCIRHGVKKLIFSSTGGALYGNPSRIPCDENTEVKPLCPYGVAKYCVEQYLSYYARVHGLKYVALRYSNVYGPRQNPFGEAGVIAIFAKKMLSGEVPTINGDGAQTRDFVYVGDVALANLLAAERDIHGVSINIGSGIETSVNEIFEILESFIRSGVRPVHAPAIKGEVRRIALDYSLAKKLLGWTPRVNLKDGIGLTVSFFRKEV
ncbi:MAG: NAD-dependent epimerase/dehydratase family protein [Candidatus Woesearchaeota archaeon]